MNAPLGEASWAAQASAVVSVGPVALQSVCPGLQGVFALLLAFMHAALNFESQRASGTPLSGPRPS